MTPDPLSAATGQLAACRAAIAAVDAREAAHYDELSAQIARLAGLAATISRALAEGSAASERLDDLDRRVDALTRQLAQPHGHDDPGRRGRPPPRPGTANPPHGDPADPVAGLRDWVERVYRPGYGHLAVLGPCWPQHELCLYGLDILRRLWSALYLDPDPDPDATVRVPSCCPPRPNTRPASSPRSPPSWPPRPPAAATPPSPPTPEHAR